jgi:hypothetical protein
MTSFEQIQDLWSNQPGSHQPSADAIIQHARLHTKEIKRKHIGTILILSATVIVVAIYFTSYFTSTLNQPMAAVLLMLLALLVRIAAEGISYRRFTGITITANLQEYTRQAAMFYAFRKKILFLLTPLVLILYTAGFLLLLPAVKQNVSHGFYVYILISGGCFAVFISWLIIRQTKKEVQLLQLLMRVQEDIKEA